MDKTDNNQKRPVYIREVEIRYKKKKLKSGAPADKALADPQTVVELFSDLQNEAKEKLITISIDIKLKIICFMDIDGYAIRIYDSDIPNVITIE